MQAAYEAGRLLDFKMPNGRALRDCTASNCFTFGRLKGCGWLTAVGWRIRRGWGDGDDYFPGKTVGEVFDEGALGLLFMAFYARSLWWWESAPNSPPSDEPEDEFDNRRR
jgi:hypothetical protein